MQQYGIEGFSSPGAKQSTQQEPLSVTSALMLAKSTLENLTICIAGEVSEVNAKAGYKAVYFTVKDAKSSLPCMMWNNKYRANGVEISQGDKVELKGRFSVYPATGKMSFDVSSLTLQGEGELRKRIANLARTLRAQGLMDENRKKAIPAYPERIGIVTSPRGDAVHDALRTLRRRYPMASVAIAGIPVEGPGAAEGISDALRFMDAQGCDVILLVRGGGSLESLMPFNDEGLARTIAACTTPIITGIGHEPDTTIADLVADVRASTPTGAAQAACPESSSLTAALDQRGARMSLQLSRRLELSRSYLDRFATRPLFTDTDGLFASESIALDTLHARLERLLPATTSSYLRAIEELQGRLVRAIPAGLMRDKARVDALDNRLVNLSRSIPQTFENMLALRAGRLHALSPLSVLARGYSMARDDNGHVISHGADAIPGHPMHVTVSDAIIHCTVDSIDERGEDA